MKHAKIKSQIQKRSTVAGSNIKNKILKCAISLTLNVVLRFILLILFGNCRDMTCSHIILIEI